MQFLKQIGFEIKNTLKSKFILILGIIVLAASFVVPSLTYIGEKRAEKNPNRYPGIIGGIMYDYMWDVDWSEEPLIIDGITVSSNNPFYWDIKSIEEEKEYMDKGMFSSAEVADIYIGLLEKEQEFYLELAQHIESYDNYMVDLGWPSTEMVRERFFYENNDKDSRKLYEAASFRLGMEEEDFKEKYIDIKPEDKLRRLDEIDEKLLRVINVIENDDFPDYVDLRIDQEKSNIENLKERIEVQERLIIENPSQEEWLSEDIKYLKREIEYIETGSIPTLEYRLEHNVIPGEDIWQNTALEHMEMYKGQLTHTEILSEEDFNKDRYEVQRYGSYRKYVEAMEAERDVINNNIIIAERSLAADKPDMKFVPNGVRNKTSKFLSYSLFVALFGIFLGGWIIASEFQQGTIRLLMIRPKTRTKILLSKFISGLSISLGIYIVGSLINLVFNGVFYGFGDFSSPNFTISGEISFFAHYTPKLLSCFITIIFAYSFAFLFSVLVRNAAVAIIIPMAVVFGSNIALSILAFSTKANSWLAYSPLPYFDFAAFYNEYSSVNYAIENGIAISLTYGIILMLALSAISLGFSLLSFKRRDITN